MGNIFSAEIRKKVIAILQKYPIEAAYLFGSAARRTMHAGSDVDIAVRFTRNISLARELQLANELSRIFGRDVDIVNLDAASLPLKFRVYSDRTLIFAKKPRAEVLNQARELRLYYDYKYYYDRFHFQELKRMAAHGLT